MARELQHPTSKEEEKAQETAEKAEKMTMGRCGWGGLSYTRNLEQQRFWSLRKKFPPSKSTPTIGTFFLKSSPLTEIDSTQNELKEQLQRCEGKVSKMSLEAFLGKNFELRIKSLGSAFVLKLQRIFWCTFGQRVIFKSRTRTTIKKMPKSSQNRHTTKK